MDIVEFLVLTLCLLGTFCLVIRIRSIASVEGFCAFIFSLAVLTDGGQLLIDYYLHPATLPLRGGEFAFRSYPAILHILTFLVLLTGLFLANPRPDPISRTFSTEELRFIRYTGSALAVLGIIMAGITIWLTGALSASTFFHGINNFRAGDAGKTGGFFYRGSDIAVFGLALLLPSARKLSQFVPPLAAMLFVSLFLRANKGGFEFPILWSALILYTYNPRRFWSLAKPKLVLGCALLALLGIGIKSELLSSDRHPLTMDKMVTDVFGPMGTRWGDDGVYRGYCQFINLWPKYRYLFAGYPEAKFALTSWIPRMIEEDKQSQPTVGFGFMVHSDGHIYKDESPAIGLVGTMYADGGIYTLILYTLITGIALGMLRRWAAATTSKLQWHLTYVMFAFFGGLANEAGISSMLYTFGLVFAANLIAHLAVIALYKRKINAGGRWVPLAQRQRFIAS
jgi:hypothetical protein